MKYLLVLSMLTLASCSTARLFPQGYPQAVFVNEDGSIECSSKQSITASQPKPLVIYKTATYTEEECKQTSQFKDVSRGEAKPNSFLQVSQ